MKSKPIHLILGSYHFWQKTLLTSTSFDELPLTLLPSRDSYFNGDNWQRQLAIKESGLHLTLLLIKEHSTD